MIAFDLECLNGHLFEGWFNDNKSFEDQLARKLVVCPFCDNTKVRKILSPVTTRKSSSPRRESGADTIDYRRLAMEIADYVKKNFDDVGTDFTKEALKMHYGVTEKRSIKGSATAEEEEVLKDEGIDFLRIPVPKVEEDDDNKKN